MLRNAKIQTQQNYLPKPLPHAKANATKASPQVRLKKRKKLSGSRTTLRNNSKALERCENNFAWHF